MKKHGLHNYFSILITLLLSHAIYSDEIFLSNGQSAKTEIIDTNGCDVKILRNGNKVSIKKNAIDKIIWKLDTINFTGFICTDKIKPAVRFQDTPEYRLMGILDNAGQLEQVFKENSKIAFLSAPLQGDYNAEEFAGIQSSVIEIFKLKGEAGIVNPRDMLTEIESGNHNFDYTFFARKYDVEIRRGTSNFRFSLHQTNSLLETESFTTADFILFDIPKGEIVFRTIVTWSGSGYSLSGKWQKENQKEQTERNLDENGQEIKNRIVKDVSEYLGIEK
jgi:hypothetical protein